VGLTESSRCPECGRPLVEVLQRRGTLFARSKRYKSPTHIFGLPLLCVAIGPYGDQKRGVARGIVAVGDIAIGWVAIGLNGPAFGIFAFGGLACGVCSMGGLAVGLLATGGGAIGGMAVGGGAIGLIAFGGGALGLIALAGGAIGYYAMGGGAWGVHVVSGRGADPVAAEFFARWSWFFGPGLGSSQSLYRLGGWLMVGFLIVAVLSGLALLAGYLFRRETRETAGDS
jgi:hypothetical protein